MKDIAKTAALVWKASPAYTSLLAALALLQGCAPVIQLWVSKLLFDSVSIIFSTPEGMQVTEALLTRLLLLIGAQAGLMFVTSAASTFQNAVYVIVGELLSNQISLQVLHKTNSMELAFFEDSRFYDRLQNAYQEAGVRPLGIVSQIFSLCQTTITLLSVTFLLLRLNWILLPLIFVTTLPILYVQSRYGERNYWMLRQRAPELRKQHYLGMLLTNDRFIKEIRVFGIEGYFVNLYKSLFNKFYTENRRLILKRSLMGTLASLGSTFGWLLTAGYVVFRTAQRALTLGDFALYTQAISTTQGQLQSLLRGLSSLYSDALFVRNLFEFLALPARDLNSGKQWTEPIREIEFRNVSFRYPNTTRDVLHNVSFNIRVGQSLALVGKNGAGKTTIVKLLCRLYDVTDGEIFINGKNVAEYTPRSVQEQIAVLFQDYAWYCLSVQENIGVGRISDSHDMDKIQAAARQGGADAFVSKLPGRYDTVLGRLFEGGVELSGGEWQKVALARSFFRNGGIMILDEPTASLDAEAECETFEKLLEDSLSRITLLISHRFSTVRMADQILVLENGQCIEMGSHGDLMQKEGQYAHLFKLQARGYETADDGGRERSG